MKRLTITLCFLIGALSAYNQNIFSIDSAPNITSCDATLTDSGGESGDYGPNENFVTTICSDDPGGLTHIRVIFTGGYILSDQDKLYVFDGSDTNADTLYESILPAVNESIIVQTTAANAAGCMTIQFVSNGAGNGAGWLANLSCISQCQPIVAQLDGTFPEAIPTDTGWIDICPGDSISFSASGVYPQSGLIYNQSDNQSQFLWDFGDGVTVSGQNVSHVFDEPGGYRVQLLITDQLGCENTNSINQRVRVAPAPVFDVQDNFPSEICLNDTINLSAIAEDTTTNSTIVVMPTQASFKANGIRSDSIALPDGVNVAYETIITFDQFLPGQTLEFVEDIESICVVMEHSWLRDLEISLTCPDGTSIILHDHPTNLGDEVFLGSPIDDDDFNIIPGIGAEYCWTNDATAGTWLEYSNTNDPDTLPPGNYNSFDSLNLLVGCPLNGDWTISVEDKWALDNGIIFSWSIALNDALYPDLEIFTPEVTDFSWVNNTTIIDYTPENIVALPQNPGNVNYHFTATDSYGCTYDTALNIRILPQQDPACFECDNFTSTIPEQDTICAGDSTFIDGSSLFQDYEPVVTFEAVAGTTFGNASNIAALTNTPVRVSEIQPAVLFDPLQQIESICVDISSSAIGQIQLFVRSPSGDLFLLVTSDPAEPAVFANTCFAPSAMTPVTGATPPYTGTFQPEGDWSTLNGAVVNGIWELVVFDSLGDDAFATIDSWSISFTDNNNLDFFWSPTTGVECVDCPSTNLSPDVTTEYILSAFDPNGCNRSDTITIVVNPLSPAPDVSCNVSGFNEITFSWPAVPGLDNYEVNVDEGGWIPANGGTSHTVIGLNDGDIVTIQVEGINLDNDCPTNISFDTCTYTTPCFLQGVVDNTLDPTCYNTTDGSAEISAMNNNGQTTYTIDGGTPQANGSFSGLASGPHEVVIIDQQGCSDTVLFNLDQPDTLVLITNFDSVNCNGGNDGSIVALPQNGQAPFDFDWTGPSGSLPNAPAISSLSAGNYCVTLSDFAGCQISTCIELPEPTAVELDFVQTPSNCATLAGGSATAIASGGTGGFTYQWSNSATSSTINDVFAGTYSVTVQDANNCEIIDSVEITSPDTLSVDNIIATDAICNGEANGSLEAFVSGGIAPYSYQWSDPSNQMVNPAVNLEQGTYTLTVTDANDCITTITAAVNEPATLSVLLDITDVDCFGEATGVASATVNGGIAPYGFDWAGNLTTDTFANDFIVGNYTLIVTDISGCTQSTDFTIDGPDEPVNLTIEQTLVSCNSQNNSVAVATASGGSGGFQYTWSNNDMDETAENLAPQIYFVTVTDVNGCTESIDIFIEEHDIIEVELSEIAPSCFGFNDGSIEVTSVTGGAGNGTIGDYNYQWSPSPILSDPFIIDLEGDQTYMLTVTDNQGCSNTFESTLTEPSQITLSLDITDASCFSGDDGTAVVTATGDNPNFTYNWSSNVLNSNNNIATDLEIGTYAVTITDGNNCSADTSFAIEQPSGIEVEFETTGNTCYDSREGTATVSVSGGSPQYSYQWSNGSTSSSIENLVGGQYELTITDSQGCSTVASATVPAPEAVLGNITTQDVTCWGDSDGRINIEPQGGTPPYTFSLDGSDFNGVKTIIGLEAGFYQVFIQDTRGCSWNTLAEVGTPFQIGVDAGEDITIELGDSVQLSYLAGGFQGMVTGQWIQPYEGTLNCPDCDECDTTLVVTCEAPFAIPQITTTYRIEIEDMRGCEASDDITVRVEKDRSFFVPTGFSPNGDNQNDFLTVLGRPGTQVLTFQVFDRWGELVYRADNFDINDRLKGWDGMFRGNEMNPGTYVWYAEVEYIDGQWEAKKGQTILFK